MAAAVAAIAPAAAVLAAAAPKLIYRLILGRHGFHSLPVYTTIMYQFHIKEHKNIQQE